MNAAHLHLALVHIPVLFVPLALIILMGGLYYKKQTLSTLAMVLFVFSALIAVPTFLSGEPSEEIVEELPQVSEAAIEVHEEAAEVAFYLALITGSLALASFFTKNRPQLKKANIIGVVLLGTISSVALLRAANLGGQIRHSEIRSQQNVVNTEGKDDDDD